MKLFARMTFRAALAASFVSIASAQTVVINEIMFHPLQPVVGPEPTEWEFIELYNAGPTNVNLTGWSFTKGVSYTFPAGTIIFSGGYIVVGATLAGLEEHYPSVVMLYGGWVGTLANGGETIELKNAQGVTIDEVTYSDGGDWAVRQRSPTLSSNRGWIWSSLADGMGRSLERRNAAMPGNAGQNWTVSAAVDGTPNLANSARSANIPPIILDVAHAPIVPKSTDSVVVTARVLNEAASGVTTWLFFRTNQVAAPTAFVSTAMFDDGAHGDGVAGDKLFGVILPPMPNNMLIEFYVQASDGQANVRTWPGPAFEAADLGGANLGQLANAMFQVDDTVYSLLEPLYKLVMTPAEVTRLGTIFNDAQSDAQVNATIIIADGTGTDVRYLCGVRNRGNGSRNGSPHNHRLNFPSDRPWRGVTGLNVNARVVPAQVAGSMLAQKAGAAGANVHFARLLMNNVDSIGGRPDNNGPAAGLYAANEAKDGDWSDRSFPDNGGGDVYLVQRNIQPPNFDYRGTDPTPYKRTYFKQSNVSADDWSGLMAMLEVMGENQTSLFTTERARSVINVEQWLLHLAVMNMFGNNESGVNTGNNDDYYMYSGTVDRRFQLIYHDLDTVLGLGGAIGSGDTDIFRATCCPISGDSEGIWRAMAFFMHHPEVEPLYYRTLQDLIDGPFSAAQFNSAVDTLFANYPDQTGTANTIKGYMATRRTTVQGVINGLVPPSQKPPRAAVSGTPRAITALTSATLTVGGDGVTHYRYRLNSGTYGAETPIATPIPINNLPNGSSNAVYVIGKNTNNVWQLTDSPTVVSWRVNTSWPGVRLNEVLARNQSAVGHEGTFPDLIEFYNEGSVPINLAGLRLTDDLTDSNKFVFPTGISLAPGAYMVLYANAPDGTSGTHLGFSLNQNGETLYLLQAASAGGAILDSVQFGPQVADRSIGRFGNSGDWILALPTFGAVNAAQALGSAGTLKINEWFAASEPPLTEDFIELYNPASLPVAMGGLYLTDQPLGRPGAHLIAQNSFVGSRDFATFIADGQSSAGPDHLNFRLSADLGSVALFDAALREIDSVIYTPQNLGISRGRCPDGGATNYAVTVRTPGAPNYCPEPPPPPPPPVMSNIVPLTAIWRYYTNGVQPDPNWTSPSYDDSGWPGSGPGLLGRMRTTAGAFLPEAILTPIGVPLNDPGKITYHFRSQFNLPAAPNYTSLQISNVVDDGAVFYCNGVEVGRYRITSGPIDTNTIGMSVTDASWARPSPATFSVTNLRAGNNVLAVEVHNTTPTSADIMFGMRLDGITVTNIVTVGGLVINEVLADNRGGIRVEGRSPDWIEFYNPTAGSVDMGGMSLNDQANNTAPRWVFPAGSLVPARGYLVIYADGDLPSSPNNTGFGLKAKGGGVYLFNKAPNTNQIIDSVEYGLQSADLSIGRVPAGAANWTLTIPTPGLTNVASALGNPTLLRVNEWMADPATGDDWFEIYNGDTRPVSLAGLRLTDTFGDPNAYRIPALSYAGAGSNAFVRFEADNPATPSGPEHVNFKLAREGDSIYLLGANNGPQIDAVTFGAQQLGVSQGRLPDGGATIVSFPQSSTPEDSNFLPMTSLVVNEVLTHTDLPLEDAIEIRNTTAQTIDLSGWWLSDSKDTLRKYPIQPGTTIAPFGFKVFYEADFNNDAYGAPFSLSSSEGDQVYLSEAGSGQLTGYRAIAKFGPSANGVSFGRYVNSAGQVDYVAMSGLTFGTAVTPQSPPTDIDVFRTGAGAPNSYPKVGPVIISEIMYHPPDLGSNDNVIEEFIELRNTGSEIVPLFDPAYSTNGWRLRDAVDFQFNATHSIAAGGHLLVVSFDPATNATALAAFRAKYGANSQLAGPYSGKLDNSSESVELVRPDAPQSAPSPNVGFVPYILVEKVVYADRAPWPTNADGLGLSLQRVSATGYGNDSTNWVALTPSPGPTGNPDADLDGMPDDWENTYGFDRNNPADAAFDADEDGLSNREEYLAGTHPRDASSSLSLSAQRVGANVELGFRVVAGRSYTVLYSDRLGAGWLRLVDVPAQGTGGPVVVPDDSVMSRSQRFYRLITPANP